MPTSTANGTELRGRESILRTPVVEDATAYGETHACRENREKARPQKTFCVRRNRCVVNISHSCAFVFGYSGSPASGNGTSSPWRFILLLVGTARTPRAFKHNVERAFAEVDQKLGVQLEVRVASGSALVR